MGRFSRLTAIATLLVAVSAIAFSALADETSTGDKLRILYSNRFTFDDRGIPLITIELASGEQSIELSAPSGMVVLPDGDGGAALEAGARWVISAEGARAAVIRDWTVVERIEADDERGAVEALKRWTDHGYAPRRFEVGTIFGVEGEVIDSREVLIAVSPVARGKGGEQARQIATKHKVQTSVHPELVRRPQGTIVARSGETVVRNPSVIWFRPRDQREALTVEKIEVGRGGSQLGTTTEQRRFWGNIYITIGSDGKLTAVNAVAADKLLAGLVPSEIFPDAHEQALQAQAIAARTELLEKIGTRHLTDPYLLCSTQHCQVYSGAGREHPRTTRAVTETRGLILLRDGGGLVDARYSASCGGHGSHNDDIWGGSPDPSLRGGVDVRASSPALRAFSTITDKNIGEFLSQPAAGYYCGATRYGKGRFRWTRTLAVADLTPLVEAQYPNVGEVRGLVPLERDPSGRIARLQIVGRKRTIVATGDLHIRRLLGGLRSTLFTVSAVGPKGSPTAFEVRGAGFGHGVGMCQTGAIGMAEQGKKQGEILHHYYPGSHPQRLY